MSSLNAVNMLFTFVMYIVTFVMIIVSDRRRTVGLSLATIGVSFITGMSCFGVMGYELQHGSFVTASMTMIALMSIVGAIGLHCGLIGKRAV